MPPKDYFCNCPQCMRGGRTEPRKVSKSTYNAHATARQAARIISPSTFFEQHAHLQPGALVPATQVMRPRSPAGRITVAQHSESSRSQHDDSMMEERENQDQDFDMEGDEEEERDQEKEAFEIEDYDNGRPPEGGQFEGIFEQFQRSPSENVRIHYDILLATLNKNVGQEDDMDVLGANPGSLKDRQDGQRALSPENVRIHYDILLTILNKNAGQEDDSDELGADTGSLEDRQDGQRGLPSKNVHSHHNILSVLFCAPQIPSGSDRNHSEPIGFRADT